MACGDNTVMENYWENISLKPSFIKGQQGGIFMSRT
jgi:hypothetical protein